MQDSVEQLRIVAEAWMERVWRQRDIEAIDQLHAPDFIDHSSAGRETTNAAYKAGIIQLYRAFPDWTAQTEDLLVCPNTHTVTIRWSATGTHKTAFLVFLRLTSRSSSQALKSSA